MRIMVPTILLRSSSTSSSSSKVVGTCSLGGYISQLIIRQIESISKGIAVVKLVQLLCLVAGA